MPASCVRCHVVLVLLEVTVVVVVGVLCVIVVMVVVSVVLVVFVVVVVAQEVVDSAVPPSLWSSWRSCCVALVGRWFPLRYQK